MLWYSKPAEYFDETLVLGNGKHGASVFGGVASNSLGETTAEKEKIEGQLEGPKINYRGQTHSSKKH
jgi:Glycosyl hydrolase family 65, N-terminal domain